MMILGMLMLAWSKLLINSGLRKAKVPMMVYSCGGFSRCFRVCRFYDVEV